MKGVRVDPAARTARANAGVLWGQVHGRHHVGGASGARDERGPPVDHPVEDAAGLVVRLVARADELAAEIYPERFDGGLVQRGGHAWTPS
jgi:hypothetical protein